MADGLYRVVQAPPRDFRGAERLAVRVARSDLLAHLKRRDLELKPPSHAEQRALLEAALVFAFQAGALWRDNYPDHPMFIDLVGISTEQ
jgi:hypothetical protein